MNVHLLVRDRQLLHRRHGHDRERFIHLVQIDVLRAPAGALEERAHRAHRRGGEPARFLCVGRVRDDAGERCDAAPLGLVHPHQYERRRAVGDRARIGRCHRAVLAKRRAQVRDAFDVRLERLLVAVDALRALAGRDLHGYDFGAERAVANRILGARERCDRKPVLRFAREAIALGAVLGEGAHEATLVVGILQPVEKHVVLHLAVTETKAGARLG